MVRSLAALFGILGVLLFIAATIIGGLQFPDYSHFSQYISETYATGTPWGTQLRYFGFIPSGLLITLFALFAARSLPRSRPTTLGFAGLGVFYGLGTVICGIFVCDAGCNRGAEMVTPSQVIHNAMGFLTYASVPWCLLVLGAAARSWKSGQGMSRASLLLGALAGVSVIFFLSAPVSPFAGLVQRIAEGSILTWIMVCSLYLLRAQRE